MIWPFKPKPPPQRAELSYLFTEGANGPRLCVEIPTLEQKPLSNWLKDLQVPVNHQWFVYLIIDLADGLIRRRYTQTRRADLNDLVPLDVDTEAGWTFMLGAIELVNANQFESFGGLQGFNPMWDIASMMENGERCLFNRNAYPHDAMLRFSNQLRQVLAPVQAAQRPNRANHIRLMKLRKTGSREDYDDVLALLQATYEVTFKPPELLF